jgi:SAM-dependent methyltransferase
LIRRYYGAQCRILEVRRAAGGGAWLFVVEATLRGRPLRLLGTLGRTRELMEHSAMDLSQPERLVFPYERVMLTALSLAAAPRSVLLLGLGGGAMCRHLAAYFPDAAVTVVERERAVIAFARKYFHLERRVLQGDAAEVVADRAGEFDAVLVDLYDASGAAPVDQGFWRDCLAALRPGGAMAVNWAGGWSGAGEEGTPHQRIARAAPDLPGSFLAVERGPRGNIIQLAPTEPDFRVAQFRRRFEAFARRHGLPREDREVLQHCEIRGKFAARARPG